MCLLLCENVLKFHTIQLGFFFSPPILSNVGNRSAGQATAPVRDVKPLRNVARQPIFDRKQKVFGYEPCSAMELRTASPEPGRGIAIDFGQFPANGARRVV